MILSNVNIGSGPSAGDGDRLRTAFSTINQNFARIQSNVNAITNSVSSVAGRTGNVVLTTQDIVGINNYSTITYVDSKLSANVANLQANITLIQADINTLYGNAGVQSATLATLTANAAVQAGSLATLTSNAASQAGELTTLLSNAAVQAGEIASLLSNAGSQHEAISSLQSNAAVQAGLIAALQANVGVSNYGNSNVASYLTTYSGNIAVGNIVFDDLSVQTTAYTGTQWRSNLSSNVTVKPTWLSYVPGGKNQEGTQYGFDSSGMFFTSNADGDFAYPIQTSLHFHEQDVLEVAATIYFGATNNDHGLCIFPADTHPIWQAGSNTSRIAFQYSSGIPVLYGQTTANTAPGSPVLSAGNYYTIKFKYDPGNTVIVETFSGNTATGSPIDTRSLSEVLPAGDYKLGFDADNDVVGVKSYWTNLVVRTLTNTVVNDLEVQGQVIGNLIPQSNVAQSLGNVTHQWKDLWVSNSTVYINSIPLSIDNGGNLLINGNTVAGSSYANVAVKTYLENYDGDINFSSGHKITQQLNRDFQIRVSDNESDGWALESIVDDGSSVDLTKTSVQYNQFSIHTDLAGGHHQWNFQDNGQAYFPGAINGPTGSNLAIRIGGQLYAAPSYIDIETRSPVGDALISQVRVGDPNVTISTASTAHQWIFEDTNKLVIPQHSVITTANANGGLGGNTISIIGGASDAVTWNSNPGGNVDIQGGYGSFGDGGGGNGGDVNIRGGGSSDAQPGRVIVNSGAYNWTFDSSGILNLAAGGSIYAAVNDPIDIRVRDSGNVGYAIEQSVRDGTGTLQTLTSLDRQEFKIYTDFQDTNNVWTFAKSGQFSLAGNLRFPDSTVQTTAWTGTVAYGNTIAIGYRAGFSSQGNTAVAIGSFAGNSGQGTGAIAIGALAGQTSQGTKGIGIGDGAALINQDIEAISLGPSAGEQNQGQFAIAIGSATAYQNQGVGAVAIGTSAGALYQGQHAIAIGTGAGNGLQGNNSIILNATGSMLDQTTDNTFTVKPIRSASAGNILYYDPSSGEITYSTNSGGGSYGNANVATFLSSFGSNTIVTTGNVSAANVRANNNVFFGTGNARITTDDNTSILLTPDTTANALAGVKIGGNGYLLAPNGARNITLNYGSVNGAVGLQANVTVGVATSSILTVNGNVTANNISTIGNILSTGASGKIGYSSGGYVIQSGNTSGVTLNTVSGNIKLDTVNIAVNTTHSLTLTSNKLDANDIILVQGQDSSAIDLLIGAYYITTNTAFIYLRNISGSSLGPIAPTLKFIIVKAPSA